MIQRTLFNMVPVAAVTISATCQCAHGQLVYNELIQGDLSDDRFVPTVIAMSPGSNQIAGFMAGDLGGGAIDRDYFTITIPQGFVLSQIVVDQYFSPDPVAFLAVQPGPIFPNDPMTVQSEDLLGWVHMGQANVGEDILIWMSLHGQGFTPPLPAGQYTFWGQQLGEPTDYVLDFIIEAPAPGVLAVPCAASVTVLRRRRRTTVP